jgi:hypothetical protein
MQQQLTDPALGLSRQASEDILQIHEGHDPYAYLKDILTRLPTHKASRIGELLPHRWQPTNATT